MSRGLGQRQVSALITAVMIYGLGLGASAQTASRLPPTQPTSISNPYSNTVPIAIPAPVDSAPRYRARVTYQNGMLEVHADNSSLNQILRDIALTTGMKIVGGVADQRVYGSYGPAPAGTVLQTLLDGTGTNILLQETPAHAPEELVLTPRAGGPAPPPPNSPIYNATETEPELPIAGEARPVTQAPTAASGASPGAQPASGIVNAPNLPVPGNTTANLTSPAPANDNPKAQPPSAITTTNQASPNGVKTPEQIYEELKLLQQRKANSPANSQGAPTPH